MQPENNTKSNLEPSKPGPGRPKGAKNKTTVAIKTAIMEAFEKAGGTTYLYQVAMDDPKTFCTLLAKVLPTEISADLTGDLKITWEE